jgi:hypothetical protein
MQQHVIHEFQSLSEHGFNPAKFLVLAAIACVVLITAFYHEYMTAPVSFWNLQKMVAADKVEVTNVLATAPKLSEQQKKILLGIAVTNSSVDTLRFLLAQPMFASPSLLAGARDMAVRSLRPDMLPLLLTQAPPDNQSQWAAQSFSEAVVNNGNFLSDPEEETRRVLVTRQLIELGALDLVYQQELLEMQNKTPFPKMRALLNDHFTAARKPEPPVASGAEPLAEMPEAPAEMPEAPVEMPEVAP